jgi:predicted nucleic acid-binding protein
VHFLLDTNHLGAAVKPESPVRQRIRWMKSKGATLGTCVPALCELAVGAHQVRDPATYRKALSRLLTALRIWGLDEQTAALYGDVYHQLRQRGLVCSQVDIMLAALARQLGLILLTSDRDFDPLPGLTTENWLES